MKNKWIIGILATLMIVTISFSLNANAQEMPELGEETIIDEELADDAQANEDATSETSSDINFAGILIEIGKTSTPTELIIQDNKNKIRHTVEVTDETKIGKGQKLGSKLDSWIPGDQIRVIGEINDNTKIIEAKNIINLSHNLDNFNGINGFIVNVDPENEMITYEWKQQEYDLLITSNTRIVVSKKNPAQITDLEIGDRIRGRIFADEDAFAKEARILLILRRGDELFEKQRTITFQAELIEKNDTTIKVKAKERKNKVKDDVNDLRPAQNDIITINIKAFTNIVRKYNGKTTLDEFHPGDDLMIVGKLLDDGSIDAKVIKDTSIWRARHAINGRIVEIDLNDNIIFAAFGKKIFKIELDNAKIIKNREPAQIEDLETGDRIGGRGLRHNENQVIKASIIYIKTARDLEREPREIDEITDEQKEQKVERLRNIQVKFNRDKSTKPFSRFSDSTKNRNLNENE